MIDSFKKSIGPAKLKDMQKMFANGYSQLVQKESLKKKSNPIQLKDYIRSFDDYKEFNWLFHTKVTQEYLPDLANKDQ